MHKYDLSIIIPCKNEEENILNTINSLTKIISSIDFEIVIINDFSSDKTFKLVKKFFKKKKNIKIYNNITPGLGGAINLGLNKVLGKFSAIMMADLSDDPKDLLKYFNLINNSNHEYDAIFGSRFIKKSKIYNYPIKKLILNRVFNYAVKFILLSDYSDFTNAFKIYKSNKLKKMRPFISTHFNIFLEIPLKFILLKHRYKIIPISWKNRKFGKAKFKINELGSKYLFTLFYLLKIKFLKII